MQLQGVDPKLSKEPLPRLSVGQRFPCSKLRIVSSDTFIRLAKA